MQVVVKTSNVLFLIHTNLPFTVKFLLLISAEKALFVLLNNNGTATKNIKGTIIIPAIPPTQILFADRCPKLFVKIKNNTNVAVVQIIAYTGTAIK